VRAVAIGYGFAGLLVYLPLVVYGVAGGTVAPGIWGVLTLLYAMAGMLITLMVLEDRSEEQ
jgi:hypothetical protein